MIWKIAEPGPTFVHRYNDYGTRAYVRTDLMRRISQYLKLLNQGVDPFALQIHFISAIKSGIIEIADGEIEETSDRIYVYPDSERAILHLLTMGNHVTREFDIACCEMLIQRFHDASNARIE